MNAQRWVCQHNAQPSPQQPSNRSNPQSAGWMCAREWVRARTRHILLTYITWWAHGRVEMHVKSARADRTKRPREHAMLDDVIKSNNKDVFSRNTVWRILELAGFQCDIKSFNVPGSDRSSRIVLRDASSTALRLRNRVTCVWWSQWILDDSFEGCLGGGGLPSNNFKQLQSSPPVRGRGAVFGNGKKCSIPRLWTFFH